MGPQDELGQANSERLATIRSFVLRLATDAGLRQPQQTSRQIQMLIQGSIIAPTAGDRAAAWRLHQVVQLILGHQLSPPSSPREG